MARTSLLGGLLLAAALGCSHEPMAPPAAGPRPADSADLPDLPRATRVAQPGAVLRYRDATLTLGEVKGTEVAATLSADGKTSAIEATLGDYRLAGDYLLRFTKPQADGAGKDIRVSIAHVPSLRASAGAGAGNATGTRVASAGDVLFFGETVVAVGSIREHDPSDPGDDSAAVLVAAGRATESERLVEFHSLAVGPVRVSLGNLYSTGPAGAGTAEVSAEPLGGHTEARDQKSTLHPGSALPLPPDYRVTVESVAALRDSGEPGPVATLKLEQGISEQRVRLLPGEGVRWKSIEVIAEEMEAQSTGEASSVSLRAGLRDKSVVPVARPGTAEPSAGETHEEAEESSEQSRSIRGGEQIEFNKLKLTLAGVIAGRADTLTGDVAALLAVTPDGAARNLRIRPRQRETVRAGNRWWIIEVESAEYARQALNSRAKLHLTTGEFLQGAGADPTKPRPR